MKKRGLALLVVGAMVLSMLSGCGNTEEPVLSGENMEAGGDMESADEDEEMAEINVSLMVLKAVSDDSVTDPMVDAINVITEKEINTHVNITFQDINTYNTQIPIQFAANEKVDLMMFMPSGGTSVSAMRSLNQIIDMSGYLEQYGQDVLDTLGDLIKGCSYNDAIYGVPANRVMVTDCFIVMRKDILDQLGLTEAAENMNNWEDYKAILEQVTAQTDLAGIGNSASGGGVLVCVPFLLGDEMFSDCVGFDTLGESNQMLYVDQETGKVGCYTTSEDYAATTQRAFDWFNEGLIYKDASNAVDYGDTLLKNDIAFSFVVGSEYGIEATKRASIGMDVICKKITSGMLSTGTTTKFGFSIPVCATEPEAAVKFLNLMYTNADIQNILSYGAEGRDWIEKDGYAAYPEGVTAENVLYHQGDFLYGNQFITLPWEGAEENLRENQKEAMNNAEISKYIGFTADVSGIENEITACYNVITQYGSTLNSGTEDDFDSMYSEFMDKMNASGMDKIINAYQEQLDAWVAEQ